MPLTEKETRLVDLLDSLGIAYFRTEHPAVNTIQEARRHWGGLPGAHCKNLFLRNQKGRRHYLVILEHSKSADLRRVTEILGEDRLSFASPERLKRYLDLEPGAVSPFGLIHDKENHVEVLIDKDLEGAARIYFHPNVNTATLGMSFVDFRKYLDHCGNRFRFIKM